MENILGKESRRFWMGISIIFIFLYHLVFFSRNQVEFPHLMRVFITGPIGNGWVGVDVFFFLSAFGLCWSFENKDIKTFYLNRVKRILPIYIVFACVVTAFFMRDESWSRIITVWLKQITGLNILTPIGVANSVEWFTPALIFTYIAFPLLFHLTRYMMRKPAILYTALISLILGVNALIATIFPMNFATRLPVIIVGICTYFCLRQNDERRLVLLYTTLAILSIVSSHWMMQLCLPIPLILYGLNHIRLNNNKIGNAISFIGSYSFEIYLAQVITTAYILAGDGVYLEKLAMCIALTPVISCAFIYASKCFQKSKKILIWKA